MTITFEDGTTITVKASLVEGSFEDGSKCVIHYHDSLSEENIIKIEILPA